MGGNITVKSELTKGSTFIFQMPFQIQTKENSYFFDIPFQSQSQESDKSQKYLIDLKNIRVLLIENNPEDREKIKKIIGGFEMNVVDVDSANKAKNVLLKESPFNLVLVDIVLPTGGDGFDFIRQFQKKLYLNEKCIIILPENHRRTDVDLIKQLNISSYFKKPINENKILVAISKVKGMKDRVKKIDDLFDDSSKFFNNKSLNILIAEDSEHNRALLKVFFKKYPFNLELCENGKEAVNKFTSNQSHYDLILMDLQMPVMDGYEAVEKIREFENNHNQPPLPIIAFTASILKEDIKRAMKAGCNSHISKPVKKKKLINEISKFFNISRD
jgi:CheY-like chemotaxis protein